MHLPLLALEVFCPRWSESASDVASTKGDTSFFGAHQAPLCAVLQQERVLCRSRALALLGVQLGMRASSVRMLAPSAQIYPRDVAREQQLLQACALALLQYTPQVARIGAAGLVLDIGASLRLFGGIRSLCRLVRASMQQLGVTVRLACAPNPSAAYLLACHRPLARVLQAQHLPRRLDRVPCHLLPEAQEFIPWLEGLACTQLGQLRALPRPGLQRRCGSALLQALDSVYGARQAALQFVQAPPSFQARLELFARIEHSEALLFAATALLQQLIGWLQVQQLAVRGIALVFEHERGRAALAPTRLEILLAEPCTQQPHLL
ncbi:MAG: DNA polymerase Y family protein, partial [Burkholderiales bacterium]|nr:DNA polymerase Y family protein [Burkholderiales bacterium]